MRGRIAWLVIALASLLAACEMPSAQTITTPAPAPEILDAREVIVLTRSPSRRLLERARGLGYAVKAEHRLPGLRDTLVVFRIPEGRSIPQAIAEIEAAAPGVTAGAHHLYRLQATSTAPGPFYANALIGWPESGCRARRRVGMIDAGVPAGHPGLHNGSIRQERFTDSARAIPGTHGADMAALLTGPGRLRGTRLHSAAVVDPSVPGGDAAGVVAILRAVDWLRNEDVTLVNISLAGPRNKLLDRGLGEAARQGMILVAAAGNAGPAAPPMYPAAFPEVLAVTAVDRDLAVYPRAVRGAHIDIAAPGVDLLIRDHAGLRAVSGTSAAAPFVTAALAAAWPESGGSVATARRMLAGGVRDLGAPGRDIVFGAGLMTAPEGCATN